MKLSDRYDGGDNAFEGDLALWVRGLPDKARLMAATVKLTPVKATGGTLFGETIHFPPMGAAAPAADGQGDWGTTKAKDSDFVELDFHKRRTLVSVQGENIADTSPPTTKGANLQVDVGGLYVEINGKGAVKSPPPDTPYSLPSDGTLPSLTVSKFKLTKAAGGTAGLNISSVTIRSIPTNVSVRLGKTPPFWTRLGELTTEGTSPDFAAAFQAFLASAKVENGFYMVPLVVHSDTITRLKVELEVEYLSQASVLPEGLKEVVLPFDFSTLPKAQANVLKVALPANAKVVPGNTTAHVIGTFDETRIVYGPTGAVTLLDVASVSPTDSQAQVISLDVSIAATAVDLLLAAISGPARLSLGLQGDLDGKPDGTPLLPRPVEFDLDINVAKQPTWISVPLPREFRFEDKTKTRYWIVLQSLAGEAAWGVAQAPGTKFGMQHTQDGGLSWRDTKAPAVPGPLAAFFRLRRRPERFQVPIELQVGVGDQGVRVKLDRFQATGRVDYALNFPEVATAFNQALAAAAPVGCPEAEHLANGGFEQWTIVGNHIGDQSSLPLTASSSSGGIAVAPDGQLAYVGTFISDSYLEVIDVVCDKLAGEVRITSGGITGAALPPLVAVHPDATRVYVLTRDGRSVCLVDPRTQSNLGTSDGAVLGLLMPNSAAVSPDGSQLYVAAGSDLLAIDTAALERAIRSRARSSPQSIRHVNPPLQKDELATAVAVSAEGSRLYVAIDKQADTGPPPDGKVYIVDAATFTYDTNEFVEVGKNPVAIALTPDGSQAVVANKGKEDGAGAGDTYTISIISTKTRIAFKVPLPHSKEPTAVAISPEGTRAFVASNDDATSPKGKVSVVDLKHHAVSESRQVPIRPIALAITPQGDRVYISASSDSLTFLPVGARVPTEWAITTGTVRPFCLPEPFHLVAVLGTAPQEIKEGSALIATALSQVVPAAASCTYEFSFWGVATDTGAVAEILWLSESCGLLRTDQIPVEVWQRSTRVQGVVGASVAIATTVAEEPRLLSHRKRLAAPPGVAQAEVRFVVPAGVLAGIDEVSLKGTAETVANGDLGVQKGRLPDEWNVSPPAASGFLSVPTDKGVQLRNSGPSTAELVQVAPIMAEKPFVLEFKGRAVPRSPGQADPRVELHWLKSDGSSAGPPLGLKILSIGFDYYPAKGITPPNTAQVELHLVVPSGTTLEVNRVSLRAVEPTSVPVTFVAQAPGELRVSDARVVYDQVPPAPLPAPAKGFCTPTPPDRMPGEPPSHRCFCHSCGTERTMVQPSAATTPAGRPAMVGRCQTCGSAVVRLGGPQTTGAPRLAFREIAVHPGFAEQ